MRWADSMRSAKATTSNAATRQAWSARRPLTTPGDYGVMRAIVGPGTAARRRRPTTSRGAGAGSVDPDDPRADPVRRAGAAVPDLRRSLVLERLGRLVGLAVAAVVVPGAGHELVVARRAGAVGRQVLAAGLALHDGVRDRPVAAG